MVFFLATVWRHCSSSPFHNHGIEAELCSRNSWANLLYINNFPSIPYLDPIEKSCLGQTWYLANDMQMFLFAPPIIYIMWRWKKIGLTVIGELDASFIEIKIGM